MWNISTKTYRSRLTNTRRGQKGHGYKKNPRWGTKVIEPERATRKKPGRTTTNLKTNLNPTGTRKKPIRGTKVQAQRAYKSPEGPQN